MTQKRRTTSIYLTNDLDEAIQKARKDKKYRDPNTQKPASFNAVVTRVLREKLL